MEINLVKVIIKKDAYKKLLKLSEEYSPQIICGFLIGKRKENQYFIEEVREVKTQTGKVIHFKPIFSDFNKVVREIEEEGKEITGEFHTHPDGNIKPTGRDRVIMKRLKFGFWIIASKTQILPLLFKQKSSKQKSENSLLKSFKIFIGSCENASRNSIIK